MQHARQPKNDRLLRLSRPGLLPLSSTSLRHHRPSPNKTSPPVAITADRPARPTQPAADGVVIGDLLRFSQQVCLCLADFGIEQGATCQTDSARV